MKTVVFDFDGVVHSYTSGWKGPEIVLDPPVPGIREAIEEIRKNGYQVAIVSTRCTNIYGRRAIVEWLKKYGIKVDAVLLEKPPAICYIDERAICFDGHPETLLEKIRGFRTWHESGKEVK